VPRLGELYPGICLTTEERARKNLSHCQEALNDICTGHTVGLYWVPRYVVVRRHTMGLYWVPGPAGVRRHIVGLYWVLGHAGVRRHTVGIPGHAEVRRDIEGLHWIPGHAGARGREMAGKLARDGAVQKCVGPEPSLRVCRQNMRRKTKRWMDNQQLAMWRDLSSTQRLA
jgi:hypothetical protein